MNALVTRRTALGGAAALLLEACAWRMASATDRALHTASGHLVRVVTTADERIEGHVVEVSDESFVVRVRQTHASRTVQLAEVQSLEILLADGAGVLSVGLIVLTILLLIAIIALATKTSCPLVVRVRATGPELLGEAYPGAVVQVLARWDLVPVPDVGEGEVELELRNHAHETQLTDAVRLRWVDHAPEVRILPIDDERLVEAGPMVPASRVTDLEGVDVGARLGGEGWTTDLDAMCERSRPPSESGLVADLGPAPEGAALELDLQNTAWVDVLALQGWSLLGDRLPQVQDRGRDPERAEHYRAQMRDAGIHLRVEREVGGAWVHVAFLPPVGWMVPRRVLIPLDARPGEPVRVRVVGGLGFWTVHAIGLSSVRGPAVVSSAAPEVATHSAGTDERAALAEVDGRVDRLEAPTDRVRLGFRLPPVPTGQQRTAFLHVHGWYEPHPVPGARFRPATLARIGDASRLGVAGLSIYREIRRDLRDGVSFADET